MQSTCTSSGRQEKMNYPITKDSEEDNEEAVRMGDKNNILRGKIMDAIIFHLRILQKQQQQPYS